MAASQNHPSATPPGLYDAWRFAAFNGLCFQIVLGSPIFALYSVCASVTLGLAPVAWGLLIDLIGARHGQFLGLTWTRYTVFFAAAAAAFGVTFFLSRQLDEPKAASLEDLLTELLIESPQRLWLRFWSRE